MPKDIDDLRSKIGSKKLKEVKAFAEKAKAEGKSQDEIKAAVKKKFGKEFGKETPAVIGPVIWPGR
jgi:hypothetical protein